MTTVNCEYTMVVKDRKGQEHSLWVTSRRPKRGDFVLCNWDGHEQTGLVLDVNNDDEPTRFKVTLRTYSQIVERAIIPSQGRRWLPPEQVRPLIRRGERPTHHGRMAALSAMRNEVKHQGRTR